MTSTPAERLSQALEVFEEGVAIMAQNLRRRFPDLDDAALERRLAAWIRERPGAPLGDAVGRVRDPPAPTH